MKIVVLSTDNESYLLQWWLPHHAEKFDFGVIMDFNWDATEEDKSIELYKKYVPHWAYVKVTRGELGCLVWDAYLNKIEHDLRDQFPNSWIITLNATEMLIGNLNILDKYDTEKQVLIPCHLMNDDVSLEGIEPDPNIPLLKQRTFGVHYSNDFPHPHSGKSITLQKTKDEYKDIPLNTRWMRSIHNFKLDYLRTSIYSVGRHYWDMNLCEQNLAICHMNFSPFTEKFIDRKMNVQKRLTQEDRSQQRGFHHIVDRPEIMRRKQFYDMLTTDLKSEIYKLQNWND